MIKTRKIGIKIIVILLLLIIIGCNTSFAKILEIDWSKLEFYIPEELEQEIENGAYVISCSANSNFVLDVEGPSTDNGAKVHVWTRTEAPNQKFYITYEGEGYYKIASINSAKMLDIANASKESGVQIQQYENNDTEAQRFKIVKNEDGTYSFIAKCSGMALDVYGGIFEDGGKVQQYEINGTDAQKFNLEKTELINANVNGGVISIKTAKNPNMQMDMINCSAEEGNKVHLWQRAATLAQRFEMHRVGENEIRIRTAASGGWLRGSSNKEGADVVQIGNSKTEASKSDTWKVEWDEGIILVNKETGLALTVNGDINTNGTEIKMKERTDDDAQKLLINTEYLIPTGYYTIQSKYGTMLDFPNNNQGTHLQTWTATGTSRQIFKITCESNGYKIKAPSTGFIVDVYDGSFDNAAIVQMEIDAGTTSQRWIPELLDGGYITLRNVNSGLMLNVHLFNSEPGAVINQGLEDHSDAQMWKLIPTEFTSGWFSENGSMYCYDPQTGELVRNCTRVDPMMTDPAEYGSIYDFDSEGRATWHLPTVDDLPGGTGPSAPIPTLTGDRRQRVIQLALSRLGCPYQSGNAPTGFVCDGLTAWSYTIALGDWFYTGAGAREDLQDASWQWEKIETRNGIKNNINDFKPGDLVFFGNPQLTYGPGMLDYNGEAYHAGIYYSNGIMINSTSTVSPSGVSLMKVSDYYLWNKFLGGGSPYEAETSKCEIPH